MSVTYNYGTGRRKSAVARVFIKAGKGDIVVNDKPVDVFFSRETGRMIVRQPLTLTETLGKFDIMVNVTGGGEAGQAGAVRHGITRALIDYDASFKAVLKQAGSGYRDAREVERKKSVCARRAAASSSPSVKTCPEPDEGLVGHIAKPPSGGFCIRFLL